MSFVWLPSGFKDILPVQKQLCLDPFYRRDGRQKETLGFWLCPFCHQPWG